MCQSAKTSIVAWLVAVIISLLLISKGKPSSKWNGYFILTFITVQLLEFMIWREREKIGLSTSASEAIENSDSETNAPSSETLTRLILIALWLQPLVQTFMAYRYGRPAYKPQLMVVTMAFFVMFIWSIVKALDDTDHFESKPYVNTTCGDGFASGHLIWSRSKSKSFVGPPIAAPLYLFGLLFGLCFMQPGLFGIILATFGGLSALYTAKQYGGGQASSMWCLYAIGYAFVALIMAFSRRAK